MNPSAPPSADPGVRGTLLLTGASSGIGLATAVAAAKAGWTVVATLRHPMRAGRLREAAQDAGVRVDVRALDVTDPASIAGCVQGVVADHGSLDAVVSNAGAAHVGTVETVDMAAFRACLEVNFFGPVLLTRASMPHLRAAGGRLLAVSSVGGVVGQPFNEAYCAAKFALEGFSEALAPVAAAVGVHVTLVEPGAVASDFIANAGLNLDALVADAGPYQDVVERYLARTMRQFGTAAQPPQDVAEIIVAALSHPSPALRLQTSPWSTDFVSRKLLDTDGSAVLAQTQSWLTSPG